MHPVGAKIRGGCGWVEGGGVRMGRLAKADVMAKKLG
jgi:hypothetical protein